MAKFLQKFNLNLALFQFHSMQAQILFFDSQFTPQVRNFGSFLDTSLHSPPLTNYPHWNIFYFFTFHNKFVAQTSRLLSVVPHIVLVEVVEEIIIHIIYIVDTHIHCNSFGTKLAIPDTC